MTLKDAVVLIVDDEPELRDIFAKIMSRSGCLSVHTAKDGVDAISVLLANHVDCLVTDIRMPGMNGVVLVRRLAEMGRVPPSVVFISGFSDIDKREMYGLGVESFLFKPLLPKDLLEAVEKALAARDALWLAPMLAAPGQSILIDAEKDEATSFHLGRGGFSAHYSEPLALGKVSFRCSFAKQRDEVSGEGYVRWRSMSESLVGIEIFFLDQPGRSRIVNEIETARPQSFIPAN